MNLKHNMRNTYIKICNSTRLREIPGYGRNTLHKTTLINSFKKKVVDKNQDRFRSKIRN